MLEQAWRWYGPTDSVTLDYIKMAGATAVVTALHHIPIGEEWPIKDIRDRKEEILKAGLTWSVVESIPVHEDIKRRTGRYKKYIENYKASLKNLSFCGIDTVCYNFMPVLDWTRTDLLYPMPDGSLALRFDPIDFAAFELFLLNRAGAHREYSEFQLSEAEHRYNSWNIVSRETITNTIIAGLPGTDETYDLDKLKLIVNTYDKIGEQELKSNLFEFIRAIMPTAEESGINMAIHPDDPPFSLLGLPRVVSKEEDAIQLLEAYDSRNNGLCFCTGSYGVLKENDLPGMVERLGKRINFIHLRNTTRTEERGFYESNHLDGNTDMYAVAKALLNEQRRRINEGREDHRMPMRPDHGHQMLDDLEKQINPGYSAIGRLRGLAELRGLMMGIEQSI